MQAKANDITVRIYDPKNDEDVTTCVAINNANWPDEPITFDEWRHFDLVHDAIYFRERYLFELDGIVFAEGVCREPSWMDNSSEHMIVAYRILPAYLAHMNVVYDYVLEKAQARGVKVIWDEMREDKVDRMAQIKARGFGEVMRYPVSVLSLADFDFAPFEGLLEKVTAKGIEIMTLSEIMASSDPDWMRKMYDLECTLAHDVPSPEPFVAPPFEQYEGRKFKKPSFNPDAWRIGVDPKTSSEHSVGKLVAMSYVEVPPAQPHILHTGLTGVLSDYRRMGLATALKIEVIRWAVAANAEAIVTDNEENNPMYELNVQLGFQPKPAWVEFKLELSQE